MLKRLARSLILLTISVAAAAAAGVSVRVTDPNGGAIPGAAVSLISRDGGRQTLTTGPDGACRFGAVGAGRYLIEAEARGFEAAASQPLELKRDSNTELTLSLGVAQIRSTVVVTASGTPQTTDEVSKALDVIDGSTITLRADPSLSDALLDVPGLHVEQLGGPLSSTFIKIRGLRNTDTAVLVDGLRLRDAAGPQADASGVLQDLVITDPDRIEVLRGAGSSLYGTDATGGVINIVTGEGGGRTRGSVTADGGSLGMARGVVNLAGGLLHDRLQYSLGATHWNVTSGIDGDSAARNTSGQGQLTLRLSPIAELSGRIYAGDSFGFNRLSPSPLVYPASGIVNAAPVSLANLHQYEAGTPLSTLALGQATFLPDAFDPDSTRTGRFFTGAVRFAVRPSDRLGFTAQYQDLHTTRDYGDGPAGLDYQPSGSNLSSYIGRIQTADARVDYSPSHIHHIDAGYEFEDEDFRNRLLAPAPAAPFSSDVSQRSQAIFAQDQVRLLDGRLQFAAAYRGQFFTLQPPFFEPVEGAPFVGRTFTAPPAAQTGDVSAAYTLRHSGTKLRAHAGRGYRAPSLFERFGTYFDGFGYTLYGDPALRPDRSSSIDAGIDQRLWNSRVLLSATYFYTRLSQLVIFDSSITPLLDPLGRSGGYRNGGGGLSRGVEFSASAAATRTLQISGAYTYTDSRQDTPLFPGFWESYEIPRHQYSVFATQRIGARVMAMFRYIGTSDYVSPVWGYPFRFGGLSRAQAMLSYRRPLAEFRAMRFYGKLDNLFNQTYYQDGFRTPGMTGILGTRFEF